MPLNSSTKDELPEVASETSLINKLTGVVALDRASQLLIVLSITVNALLNVHPVFNSTEIFPLVAPLGTLTTNWAEVLETMGMGIPFIEAVALVKLVAEVMVISVFSGPDVGKMVLVIAALQTPDP